MLTPREGRVAYEARMPRRAMSRGLGYGCIEISLARARLRGAQHVRTGDGQSASSVELLLRPASRKPKEARLFNRK